MKLITAFMLLFLLHSLGAQDERDQENGTFTDERTSSQEITDGTPGTPAGPSESKECSSAQPGGVKEDTDSGENDSRTFYVVADGIHTGIVIRHTPETDGLIDAFGYFGGYSYIDIGTGDAEYYLAGNGGFWLTFRALFLPTGGTVYLRGNDSKIENIVKFCDYSIRYTVTKEQFEKICRFINSSFRFGKDGSPRLLWGNDSGSRKFFVSTHSYHLFYTCNTWVAEALSKGGIRIKYPLVVTKENLYDSVSLSGKVLKPLK